MDYCDKIVGVFGHPVSENPGVVIMDAAFRSIGVDNWRFLTIDVHPDDLGNAMTGLRSMGMRGINLTIPHKVNVLQYLDKLSDEAQLIGAVNTVVNENGILVGYNTDGKGFMLSLQDHGISVKGRRVVILGSGGAARAIGVELCLAEAETITIASVEEKQALELFDLLGQVSHTKIAYTPWQGAYEVPKETDILINATPVGLFPDTDKYPNVDFDTVLSNMFVQDVIPNPANTAFLKMAAANGCQVSSGKGMMINQAAINTKLWTGELPDKDAMAEAYSREVQ